MKTVRIYHPDLIECGKLCELSATASQHVAAVLRMQPGDSLTLFCGDNHEYSATISEVQKKKVIASVHSKMEMNRESPCMIHLAQAISKGDRMEWVIQKAVELGVNSITPLLSERCVVRLDEQRLAKKQSQWQAIAVSACEQSGRNFVPKIHSPISFAHYLENCPIKLKFVLDPQAPSTWRDFALANEEMALLIGPEGGLSDNEIKAANAQEFHSLRLGPRVLRTETAAITALSVLQAIGGDL